MADTDTAPAATANATSTPKKAKKVVKKSKPTHPKTSVMVTNAITELKEKNGSSLQAIKKYIVANYKIDFPDKLAPFIRKYIKSAVTSGVLEQTKGKGVSGSFKIASASKSDKPAAKKKAAAKKTAPSTPSKAKTTGKKLAVNKKKSIKSPANKKATKAAKSLPKAATKAKSPAKPAAKKPVAKSPKAKKAKTPTKAKKTAPKPKKMTPKKK